MAEITVRSMKEKDINQTADIHRRVVREGLGQSTKYAIEDLFKSFIKKSPKRNIAVREASEAIFLYPNKKAINAMARNINIKKSIWPAPLI